MLRSSFVGAILGLGLVASTLGVNETASAHDGHDDPVSPASTGEADTTLDAVDAAWWRGSDFLIEGVGSTTGYTLYVRRENERYAPRPLATIQPGGDGSDTWLGYTCVTGDAKTAVVNLAQRWTTNEPALRDRGGLLYAVDIKTGRVRSLASGVAFKYHAVGCGAGDDVAFVRHLGVDQERSQVMLGTATGRFAEVAKVDGQLTAPVPSKGSVVALRGHGLVRLAGGHERVVTSFEGEPYGVRPNIDGGVDLLVRTAADVEVVRVAGDHQTTLAVGPLQGTGLVMGKGGRTFAPGATRTGTSPAPGFTALPESVGGTSAGELSAAGKVALAPAEEAVATAPDQAEDPTAEQALVWARTGASVPLAPAVDPASAVFTGMSGDSGSARSTAPQARLAANTPACGVPRNSPTRQAYSATNEQSEWAVQMAVRNLLRGSLARPADHLRSGLPAYAPSDDFPVPTLAGPGGVIPPAVMNGVLSQESAYRHASRRTLPGNGGNPLIGDYYGAAGGVDHIDYGDSDCGYGIAQVTSGMRADETSISANGKVKVAIDYAENIQAGANILAKKWNQLSAAGIRYGNSDPDYVDNWYTALWAYNSGVQPTAAYGNTTGCTPSPSCTDPHGHWGLGWTNNPANPDYPPDRDVFLRMTYADAEHPGDWPYQERVLGFAETPIFNYKGEPAYEPGDQLVTYPDRFSFCDASNECDPSNVHPDDPSLNYCERVDNHCWWHSSTTTVDCDNRDCSESFFRYSTTAAEPAGDNPWDPACNSTELGTAAIIVDELPDPSKNLFCPSRNWTNKGTFTYTVGTVPAADGTPLPIGEIDFHQIAAGFGAHTWFATNYLASDAAHRVTGTWKPTLPTTAKPYVIKVHIPERGASTGSAKYTITLANGTTTTRVINQHEHWDHWKSLGVYQLGPSSKVTLTNVTSEVGEQTATVAFDAMAFIPAPGTIKKTTIESVAYFDENTNIDSDTFSRTVFSWSSLETRQSAYDWAQRLTSRVLSYPDCAVGSPPMQCIKPATKAAFQRWANEVASAGSTNAVTKWLNFANAASYRPTTNKITTAWRSNDAAYKIRNKVVLSFVVNNGAIVKGTDDVDLDDRTADTHLPRFMLDIMRAIQIDYGIGLPDLSYSKEDLNEYDHQVREAHPTVDGILPGQAEHQAALTGMLSTTCLGAIQVSGGTIGYRPMLATHYVDGAVEGWQNRVEDGEGADYPLDTIGQFAHDVYETFFDQGDPPTAVSPSPFNGAPPIWQELNVAYCLNGTVKPAYGTQILRQSWMPNGYLYRDGTAISQTGATRTAITPLYTGNFQKFTTPDEQGRDNPYEDCDTDTGRNGNPWGMDLFKAPLIPLFDTEDHPDEGHLCWDKDITTSDDLP